MCGLASEIKTKIVVKGVGFFHARGTPREADTKINTRGIGSEDTVKQGDHRALRQGGERLETAAMSLRRRLLRIRRRKLFSCEGMIG